MKRPEGFDQPRPRPVRPQQPAEPAPPAAPRVSPAAPSDSHTTDPALSPGASRNAETERIEPVTASTSSKKPVTDAPASRQQRAPKPPRPPRAPRAVNEESAERKRIRKAARLRKRFERNERRRFTRNSRRRRAAWFTLAGIVAVLAIVFAVAVYSPLLALRTITVEGASGQLSAAEVEAKVDGQLGTPLALVDFGQIRTQLGTFPLIRSYVTETIPPGTIVIHVVVRTPVATVKTGATYRQIDPAGVQVSTSSKRGKLPLLSVPDQATNGPAFRSAVQVLLTMPASMLKKVTKVSATTTDDVRLTLRGGGPQIVWGASDNAALKAKVAAGLLKQPSCQTQKVINVSAATAAICGPK